ncbi:MAG: DUF4259 domain-containing protein [Myxococcota bacterium]
MGAWGTGPFDNDAARAWLEELETAEDVEEVVEWLAREVDWPDGAAWLDAEEAAQVRVTAELVAAAIGRPAKELPAELRDWLEAADTEVTHRDLDMVRTLVRRLPASGLQLEAGAADELAARLQVIGPEEH